ncbi:MAG: hypothetical protein E6G66_18070, partial [Actinobacteria bacterium]
MAGGGATGADPTGGGTVRGTGGAALRFAPRRLLLFVALAAAWPMLNIVLPSGLPAGVVLQGVVLGSLTGLSAVGLVLVYRACRIVNFAQATL